MVKHEVEILARLPQGVAALLKKIVVGGPLNLGTDLQEASLEAGAAHFLELGEEKGLCLLREIISPLDPSLGIVAYLGQMKGNKRPVCKEAVYRM